MVVQFGVMRTTLIYLSEFLNSCANGHGVKPHSSPLPVAPQSVHMLTEALAKAAKTLPEI